MEKPTRIDHNRCIDRNQRLAVASAMALVLVSVLALARVLVALS